MALLEVSGLSKAFGGLRAVHELDLTVERGRDRRPDRAERLGQDHGLQPDHRALSRHGRPDAFRRTSRHDLARARAARHHRARRRAHLPEPAPVQPDDRAGERPGRHALPHPRRASPASSCGPARARRPRRAGRASARGAARPLRRAAAAARATEPAWTLSYANRRRLEIARALATEPRLLLLDEPAAGMNPTETRELMRDIVRIRDRGVTILLIEHDMGLVRGVCDRVVALDHGVKIAEGDFETVRRHTRGARGVPRPPGRPCLGSPASSPYYGPIQALQGHGPRGAPGRDRLPARRQRVRASRRR